MEIVDGLFENVGRRISGVREQARFNKVSDGVTTLSAAHATLDRPCLVVVQVTEDFADGDGGQPTFDIGDSATDDSIAANTVFADAVKGDLFVFAGTITATETLIVTAVAATGTGTGAIMVEAVIFPETA